MILVVGAAVLAAGLMIGLTGVGGVLVVPALTALGNVELERAIAASLLGFLLAGTPAAVVHLRRNRVPLDRALALGAAAGAGALAGAFTLDQLPAPAVRLFIALLATSSGLYALVRAGRSAAASRAEPGTVVLLPLAFLIGYASAIPGRAVRSSSFRSCCFSGRGQSPPSRWGWRSRYRSRRSPLP